MKTVTSNVTTVEVSTADMQAWITRNLGQLTASSCVVLWPGMANTQRFFPQDRLALGWGVKPEELDAFLRTEIANLPPLGSYSVQPVRDNADVAAKVTWQAAV